MITLSSSENTRIYIFQQIQLITFATNFGILQSQSLELVTIMNEINVVIGGFSGEDLKWLAPATVRLQLSDYSQLLDYTVRIQFFRLVRAK